MNLFTRCLILFLAGWSAIACAQLVRQPNTIIRLPQTPPTFGYALTNAYTGFGVNLTGAATPPGETNRLFVLERPGRIVVITNLASPTNTRPVFLNITNRVSLLIEHGLLGLAFHPDYASNGYFYVFYSYTNHSTVGEGAFNRLSRFQVSPNDPNEAMENSELILFSQLDDAPNHNGGDIHFGPDGYLYVAVGDEGGAGDDRRNSQRIDRDFFAGILRIDVDKRTTNLPPNAHAALLGQTNYFVPADNPFVGATEFNGSNVNPAAVRSEFWAVGLRNPWRISFDPMDGTLYCGDVGQQLREEINVIVRGGNYGWVFLEGTIPGPDFRRQAPPGFSSIAPILEYEHGTATNQGNSVIGGLVYRGTRLPQLTGKYIFGDFGSGNIWSLTPDGTNVVGFQRIAGANGLASFARDPHNGDVLIVSHNGVIQRLIYSTNVTAGEALPTLLSGAGVFSNLTTLTPNTGVVPYDINVPFWSDNARKTRWFSVPDPNQVITFAREGNWSFPTGTVWIKHFDLELTNGVPSSAKRLETRLLVKNAGGVYGVTYRWGNSLTNATLVAEDGLDEAITINDGGILRAQVWRYPSRSQCLTCHTPVGGHALGFNTAQLNRNPSFGLSNQNQIRAWADAGYFSTPLTNLHTLRALAHATNAAVSLGYRVRSYLAANCQQCHQPGGSALGSWDARIENPLSLAGIIDGSLNNDLGNPSNKVIVPNDAAHSVLLTRISQAGALRMPPLGSNLLDTNSMQLVSSWIASLTNYQTFAQWQVSQFGSTNVPLSGAADDFDGDGSANFAEYLLGTDATSAADYWAVTIRRTADSGEIHYAHVADRGFEVQFTEDLTPPVVWQTLDVPANRPFISASNFNSVVIDAFTNAARFYRIRIWEP